MGSQWVVTTIIMIRILAITSLAFLVSADADADAYYALHAPALVPALLNSYPNWPGVSTPFSSSTCYGCRGKRSAEPGYGLVHHFVPLPLVPAAAVSSDPGYALPFYHVPHVLPAVPVVSGYGINQAHPSGSSYQHVERVEGYALGK